MRPPADFRFGYGRFRPVLRLDAKTSPPPPVAPARCARAPPVGRHPSRTAHQYSQSSRKLFFAKRSTHRLPVRTSLSTVRTAWRTSGRSPCFLAAFGSSPYCIATSSSCASCPHA